MEMDELLVSLGLDGLYGRFDHSLDSKGRVIVPSRFRKSLGEIVVVTLGFTDNCLNLYSGEKWKENMAKLNAIPASDKEGRKFKMRFLGNAEVLKLDKQGKILISEHLRKAAKLEKNITFSGMGDWAEIWDSETWEQASHYDNDDEIGLSMEKYNF